MPEDFVSIKKEPSEFDRSVCCDSGDHYPWGTQIDLEKDLIEQLEVGALAVGDVVEIRGFAFVRRKSESSDEDGDRKNMDLQLTQLKVNRSEDDRADILYGPNS